MNNLKVYLAGDVSSDKWRDKVIRECQDCAFEWLSPVGGISYSYQSLCQVHRNRRVFHIADKLKIDKADIVFAYIRTGSPSIFSGTSWELGYAYAKNKHIILVNDMKPKLACKYELIKRFADAYYVSLDEGIDHLRELSSEIIYGVEEK